VPIRLRGLPFGSTLYAAAEMPMGWLMPPAQAMAAWSIACWGMDGAAGGADAYTVAALRAAAADAAQAVSAGTKPAAIDAAAVTAALSYAASTSQAARALMCRSACAACVSALRSRTYSPSSWCMTFDRISEHDKAVNFLLRPNGRSSGQAFVYMQSN